VTAVTHSEIGSSIDLAPRNLRNHATLDHVRNSLLRELLASVDVRILRTMESRF
jgi:hypothetical protein